MAYIHTKEGMLAIKPFCPEQGFWWRSRGREGGREEGPLHWEKEDEHLSTRKLKMGWKTGGVKGFLKEI